MHRTSSRLVLPWVLNEATPPRYSESHLAGWRYSHQRRISLLWWNLSVSTEHRIVDFNVNHAVALRLTWRWDTATTRLDYGWLREGFRACAYEQQTRTAREDMIFSALRDNQPIIWKASVSFLPLQPYPPSMKKGFSPSFRQRFDIMVNELLQMFQFKVSRYEVALMETWLRCHSIIFRKLYTWFGSKPIVDEIDGCCSLQPNAKATILPILPHSPKRGQQWTQS